MKKNALLLGLLVMASSITMQTRASTEAYVSAAFGTAAVGYGTVRIFKEISILRAEAQRKPYYGYRSWDELMRVSPTIKNLLLLGSGGSAIFQSREVFLGALDSLSTSWRSFRNLT